MKIAEVRLTPLEVPLAQYYASAYGVRGSSEFLIVEVETSDGVVGIGEASLEPFWPGGEFQESAYFAIKNYLTPRIIGEDPFEIEVIHDRMEKAIAGNLYAKAAIDMALHDIQGRCLKIPLYKLLGGCYRNEIQLKYNVPAVAPEKAADIAAQAVKQGYGAVKLKVGVDLLRELKTVQAVRESVGEKILIGIDANGGWSPKVAISSIRKMEPFNLSFVEQPVPKWNIDGLAEVKRSVETPIMADESVYTASDAVALVKKNAVDMFSIYICKAGGIPQVRNVSAIAEAAGISCTLGSDMELGVGTAAKIQFAASTRIVNYPSDMPIWIYAEDIIDNQIRIENGAAKIPEGFGLGVELDAGKVSKYTVKIH